MKKFWLVLFLVFPLALFSQTYGSLRLPDVFLMKGDDLRALVTSKNSQVKLSNKEIVEINKLINERREEFLALNESSKKSIKFDANGMPIGKADPELLRAREAVSNDVSTSIYEILGEKRFTQFKKTLIDENARKNSEGLNKAMKNKKK
jgi:hypothetical protein